MDLNRKYAEHQKAVMRADSADGRARDAQLDLASGIAGQIGDYQRKLGAAASCAWSAVKRNTASLPGAAS